MPEKGRAVVGEVSWGDVEVKSSGGGNFLKLETGENRIRIVSNPVEFQAHWLSSSSRRAICSGEGCVFCKAEVKIQQRWMIKVLDRKAGGVKVLEIGPEIMNGVIRLAQDKEWGPVSKYDIKIVRVEGKRTSYQVTPCPKSEPTFSDEEKVILKEAKEILNLTKIIESQVPSGDDAQKLLKGESAGEKNTVDEDDFLSGGNEKKEEAKKAVDKPASKPAASGDDDFLDLE